jgi:very-short-patch-repair endonuclease
VDWAIAEICARQHLQISVAQLVELGLRPSAIRMRAAAGRLHRTFHGVYSISPVWPSVKARWMAAVLACGPGAALSYRDAGAAHGVRPSSRRLIDVTAPRRAGRARPGIDAHRSRCFLPQDIVLIDNIPCTSLARTLLDLAAILDRQGLNRAIERAEQLRVFDLEAVEELLARANGHPGAGKLRAAVGQAPPDSERVLEQLLADHLQRSDLPTAERNAIVEGYECDFAWFGQRLNVETDGDEFHRTKAARKRDRLRDRTLRRAGWRVERYTWDEVTADPAAVVAEIRALLRT